MSRRYEKGSILITSNRSVGEWGCVFGDPVVATAILDRLLHHWTVITRPYQIEERTLLTQYNLSRLIDRLEAAGLVTKEPYGNDGADASSRLQKRGRDARSKTWEVYDAAIAERLGDKLTDNEAETLARLLSKLRAPTP